MSSTPEFNGMTVLILEDNVLLAMELQELLGEWGARVLGPVPSVVRARELLSRQQPDIAVLDIRLRDGTSLELAAELRVAGVRCVFVSGYSERYDIPESLAALPRLTKPVNAKALRDVLGSLL